MSHPCVIIEHMFGSNTTIKTAIPETIDSLEQALTQAEAAIGRLRAFQIAALRKLDVAQVAYADGSRSLVDWTAARLDTTHDTARDLVLAARSMSLDRCSALGEATLGFERAIAETRLLSAGGSEADAERSKGLDLAGVRRVGARCRRITQSDEQQAFESQYVTVQPSLDEDHYRLWGILTGMDGRTVAEALGQRADLLRPLPGESQTTRHHRQALALATICQDSLDGEGASSSSREPVVTVLVDAALVAATGGEKGAEIVGGPRIGPAALQELLCTGRAEWNRLHGDGNVTPLGHTTSIISPRQRRAVLARDGGCTIDGCAGRYRLEAHHVEERSQGGANTCDNLTTVCWYHHHVVIHRRGFTLDPHSPPGRRRLRPPRDGPSLS